MVHACLGPLFEINPYIKLLIRTQWRDQLTLLTRKTTNLGYRLHDRRAICHRWWTSLVMQVAAAVWHICEQARRQCRGKLGDIVIALRTGGCDAPGQPGLAVAVASACEDTALLAVHHIVHQAATLEAVG